MHFRSRRRRLASVTCFAAMTFSYEGSSLLFCKSITWCPLTKAVFFVFTVEINYFYCVFIVVKGTVVNHLEESAVVYLVPGI